MVIYIVESESDERDSFEEALAPHQVRFAKNLSEVGPDAEILSTFIYSRVDGQFLDAHPKLKFIATRSTGYDHIDTEACKARGITISNVSTYGENTVAEHSFALILALARRIRESIQLRSGTFSFEALRGFDLKGKTFGVIGAGRIGLHAIRIARAFGMAVLAYDMFPQDFIAEVLDYRYVPLDELLAQCDIISLHAPLTPQTKHLINRGTIAKCKRGVLIINTARGGLIDTEALIEALDSGQVGGAGLDVLEEETVLQKDSSAVLSAQIIEKLHRLDLSTPIVNNPDRQKEIAFLLRNKELISRANVVFTPHTAFNSVEAVQRINETTVDNILSFIAGKPNHIVGAP